MSASATPQARAIHAGGYLEKPFTLSDALATVQNVLLQTRCRRLERQILETQHYVALATMAAGICHEISNPLTYVLGSLDELERQYAAACPPEARTLVGEIRKEWEMSFLPSGEAALKALQETPYDVIVSDMRMPGMDGATLLRQVIKDHPQTVRIVLSGQTEQEVSRRMVHVAHQFMAKPCDGKEIQQVIERACNLQSLLERPELRQAVGQMGQLPVKRKIYAELLDMLENPNSSMADAAAVIETDIGTSAKILQIGVLDQLPAWRELVKAEYAIAQA